MKLEPKKLTSRNSMLLVLLIFICESSYPQVFGKVFESPSANKLILGQEIFAIMPFEFEITENKKKKGMTPMERQEAESSGSEAAQSSFYTYALRRKQNKGLKVEMQELKRTNALLSRAGINHENVDQFLAEEICESLGVDAIITGEIHTVKKQSSGGAVASSFLLGYGNTGDANAAIRIYDKSGEMIWSYSKEVSAGTGDVNDMIRVLMRKSAHRFPYFIR